MRTTIRVISSILTVLLVGTTAFAFLGPMLRRSVTDESAYPSGATHLSVSNGIGSVTVREAQDGEKPSISTTRTWAFREPSSDVSTSGDTVNLKSGCSGFAPDTCSTDWHLVVPKGTRLSIENGVGEVDVAGVSGDVTARSGVGDMQLEQVSSETIEVEVGVGSARVDASEAPRDVRVRAGVGEVRVAVPTQETYRVRYSGAPGQLTNRVGDDPRSERLIDVEAGVGDVRVEPH